MYRHNFFYRCLWWKVLVRNGYPTYFTLNQGNLILRLYPLVDWKMNRTSSPTEDGRHETRHFFFTKSLGRVTYFWLSCLYLPWWLLFLAKGQAGDGNSFLFNHRVANVLTSLDMSCQRQAVGQPKILLVSAIFSAWVWVIRPPPGDRGYSKTVPSPESLPQPLTNQVFRGPRVHKCSPLVPILSQPNPFHAIQPISYFNTVLPLTPGSYL